jgi:phosphatidylethanolamine/phosphatidyl-N-methylethanolamine N-methyltransferase
MYKFFFQYFLRNPMKVGKIIPLSQSVAAQFIRHLELRTDSTPWKILEVAAGTGSITKSLISHMKENDHLDIVETDPECCRLLKDKYSNDKRISVHCTSIMDWHANNDYNFIVSTLPINSFLPKSIEKLFNHFKELGNKESVCTFVEFIGFEKFKFLFANAKYRKVIRRRRRILNTFLKNHMLQKNKVFANFLPCNVYHLKLHPSLKPKS